MANSPCTSPQAGTLSFYRSEGHYANSLRLGLPSILTGLIGLAQNERDCLIRRIGNQFRKQHRSRAAAGYQRGNHSSTRGNSFNFREVAR